MRKILRPVKVVFTILLITLAFLFLLDLKGRTFFLLIGSIFGLLLGVVMGYSNIMNIRRLRFLRAIRREVKCLQTEIIRPDFSGEQVLLEGPANHFYGLEGVGGKLYLTKRRLLFRSHTINFHPHEMDLILGEVTIVYPVLTAGLFQNGLIVCTNSGRKERFVVRNHKVWSAKILEAKEKDGPA